MAETCPSRIRVNPISAPAAVSGGVGTCVGCDTAQDLLLLQAALFAFSSSAWGILVHAPSP